MKEEVKVAETTCCCEDCDCPCCEGCDKCDCVALAANRRKMNEGIQNSQGFQGAPIEAPFSFAQKTEEAIKAMRCLVALALLLLSVLPATGQ
jgi:hypothetical protein